MSTSDREVRPVGRRARLVSFLSACFAVALLSSAAQAGTILQFGQTNPADIVTATEVGGVTTLSTAGNADGGGVSIPITITNLFGTPGLTIPAFETFVDVTSEGLAVTVSGLVLQRFSGTVIYSSEIGGAGINYLTATFAGTNGAVLGGLQGGTQVQLGAANPTGNLSFTSDFGPGFLTPLSMTIGFSAVTPPVGVSNNSFAGFVAQSAGTFGANLVPEPATFGMSCMGLILVSLGLRYDRRFRRKAGRV